MLTCMEHFREAGTVPLSLVASAEKEDVVPSAQHFCSWVTSTYVYFLKTPTLLLESSFSPCVWPWGAVR